MKYLAYSCVVLILLFVCIGCNKFDIYADKLKTVDSLNAVLNSMTSELNKIDTVFLKKSIARFNWYQEFIELNINDTISKSEADNLEHFMTSGKNLSSINHNRQQILELSKVMSLQLVNLSSDIKNKHIEKGQLLKFSSYEIVEVEKLINHGYQQQQLFHTSVVEFKTALKGVELLIRSRNSGELPTIIKDSIDL